MSYGCILGNGWDTCKDCGYIQQEMCRKLVEEAKGKNGKNILAAYRRVRRGNNHV